MRNTKRLKECRKVYERIARKLPWMVYSSFEDFVADAVVKRLESLARLTEN